MWTTHVSGATCQLLFLFSLFLLLLFLLADPIIAGLCGDENGEGDAAISSATVNQVQHLANRACPPAHRACPREARCVRRRIELDRSRIDLPRGKRGVAAGESSSPDGGKALLSANVA
jgi:hypothetical protein